MFSPKRSQKGVMCFLVRGHKSGVMCFLVRGHKRGESEICTPLWTLSVKSLHGGRSFVP